MKSDVPNGNLKKTQVTKFKGVEVNGIRPDLHVFDIFVDIRKDIFKKFGDAIAIMHKAFSNKKFIENMDKINRTSLLCNKNRDKEIIKIIRNPVKNDNYERYISNTADDEPTVYSIDYLLTCVDARYPQYNEIILKMEREMRESERKYSLKKRGLKSEFKEYQKPVKFNVKPMRIYRKQGM